MCVVLFSFVILYCYIDLSVQNKCNCVVYLIVYKKVESKKQKSQRVKISFLLFFHYIKLSENGHFSKAAMTPLGFKRKIEATLCIA